MRHIFIINPDAGKRNDGMDIAAHLAAHPHLDASVYVTTQPADATNYARRVCAENDGMLRFWACGGDGTINEVLNGVVDCQRAEIASWPSGSGNDYVKYYGGNDVFFDFDRQLAGEAQLVDVMRVQGKYAINVINFGFESAAAQVMQKVKHYPLIGGKNAYVLGAAWAFLTAMNSQCKVYADNELLNPKGRLLLCSVANGQYVGGQFRTAPRSVNDDGLMDVCAITPMPVHKAVPMMGLYQRGGHLDSPRLKDNLIYRRAKKVTVEAGEGWMLTLDGEMLAASHADIDVCPRAARFVVPKGAVAVGIV
ncbi:MAG: YegS/Rv2252/BmrU family lipid kinase [Eubacteriales bacterium]|nr:YegS/Rv2252/BmrU family lipid kinase [Eubacteriales bacterium]MDD4105438.1 YegS/Rv2252/BmrU family lipid kinase [Eubacteriales bacterium]NLO15053.1 YegS/Rv2252/BmrU family lipid kinase [Clostridiales bacterium]